MNNSIHLNKTVAALAVSLIFCLGIGLTACGTGGSDAEDSPSSAVNVTTDPTRTVTPLLDDWKFTQDDFLTDAQALSNGATNWSNVTLPHTWNANDAATVAQTSPTTVDYKRGIGWYRLEFDNPAMGATQWLQFDGVSMVADVWLNGEKLGQHRGAFTAFRFDVTGKLKSGKNVLIVKADNSTPTSNTASTAIAPLNGDFNMAGGIYRGVSLVATAGQAHFALNEAVASKDSSGTAITQYVAGKGVYGRTTSVSAAAATIEFTARVKNDAAADGSYTVRASLLESDGKTLKATLDKPFAVKAGADGQLSVDLAVSDPHLWQGISDPYLYKLVVELKDASGSTLDKVVQDFGIRQMVFDPNKGFFLNGKSTPLHGVNLHQDYLGKAWAIGSADTDESLALIKEIGANTLRLAHYPHASYTYEQADKLGLVVFAEVPFVNASALITSVAVCNQDPETTGFAANVRLQAQEFIRQQYNHASIGLWSVGNEVSTYGVNCGQTTESNNVVGMLRSLHALSKAEDPGRVTTVAAQITRSGDAVMPDKVSVAGVTDTYSVNRYFQWYYGTSETQLAAHLDELHAQNPTQPIGVSEYGAGAALTHHTDNPYGGRVCNRDATGLTRVCYQPEEYAGYVHEKNYAAMVAKDFVYGTYVWNMYDFGSGIRHEGDIGGTNTKGLVSFDRKTKKDPFFFYKANWSKTPVTYITGRRYAKRSYAVTSIKLYSNADVVTLSVNGTQIGTRNASECPMKVCEFPNVALSAGNNNITAVGKHGAATVTDTVTWTLAEDNAKNVYIAAGQLVTGLKSTDALLGSHAYGSDNFFTGGSTPSAAVNTVIANLGATTVPEAGRVWDMYREGASFGYRIPLANGTYQVTLGFLEPSATAAGARVFNVNANGVSQIANLDIFSAAGANKAALTRSFSVTVSEGVLSLDFVGVTGNAIVSNIAVVKQ
ncbi:MAG: glycoside hydrolase family 2 TIM barrel-domain containing protein [Rhodocyclaceae bacterium]